jgi:glyoxylase-like metal-dependent hydrolase (beta-lactamase superfamily II)
VQANALDVRWLLETHAHADHLSIAQWLRERWPRDARDRQRHPADAAQLRAGVRIRRRRALRWLAVRTICSTAGDAFRIGDIEAK